MVVEVFRRQHVAQSLVKKDVGSQDDAERETQTDEHSRRLYILKEAKESVEGTLKEDGVNEESSSTKFDSQGASAESEKKRRDTGDRNDETTESWADSFASSFLYYEGSSGMVKHRGYYELDADSKTQKSFSFHTHYFKYIINNNKPPP